MTTFEIVFLGLCAIVTGKEFDCRTQVPAGRHEAAPFDVAMVDPGAPHPHDPLLWIPVAALAERPEPGGAVKCWKDELGWEQADCTGSAATWATFPMKGMELVILQSKNVRPTVRKGYRKADRDACWQGDKPDADACTQEEGCKGDVSWLPEYSKANGSGKVHEDLFVNPGAYPWVTGLVRDLRGHLSAEPFPSARKIWKWEWNHPDACGDETLPAYEQRFSTGAIVSEVHSLAQAIWLVPIAQLTPNGSKRFAAPEPTRIGLKPRAAEKEDPQASEGETVDTIQLRITNFPRDPDPEKGRPYGQSVPKSVQNKCYITHFDAYKLLQQEPRTCRRIPYIVSSNCEGELGGADPFCSIGKLP